MKEKKFNFSTIELILFVVIWMAVYSIPFFSHRIENQINWGKVTVEWIRMSAFLVIFLLNTLWLVPGFLFKKKYKWYFIFTFLAIVAVIVASIVMQYYLAPVHPLAMPQMELGPGMPPMELGPGMPPPIGYTPAEPPEQRSMIMIVIDNLIVAVLVVGVSTSFKLLSQWLREENRRIDLEKEQMRTELALLRHQVSPHFFMNTLNNIHALIDINTDDAKDTIIRLSTMMRYLLYDTAHGKTTLRKEIDFIESYITLMKLRFPENVHVVLEIPENINDCEIPPMLFISFLENAFKHGVSYRSESFVKFKIEQDEKRLNCVIRNSKHKSNEILDESYSGIGMANIKKSLKLLFGSDYTLSVTENEKEFDVKLSIPVI